MMINQLSVAGAMCAGMFCLAATGSAQEADTIHRSIDRSPSSTVSNVVEELSIGVLEGDPNYTFLAITDLAIGRDGSILLLESPASGGRPSLRLYSSAGRYLRNVGAQGRGPGEYFKPTAVATLPDGRFLLLDQMNRRINVYTSTGRFSDEWVIPNFSMAFGLPGQMRVGPFGIIAIRFALVNDNGVQREKRSRRREAFLRLQANGKIIDTLPVPDLPDLFVGVTKTRLRGPAVIAAGIPMPYFPAAMWQYSPLGYFVTGISNRYALDLRIPRALPKTGGLPVWRLTDPVFSIRLNVHRVTITESERADQKAHVQNLLDAIPGTQEGRVRDTPLMKPFFKWIYVADDGRIWVNIHTESSRYNPRGYDETRVQPLRWREPNVFDVFEPSATYVGRVRLPYDIRILKLHGDRIWAVVRDEFDVEYLKQYRVRWM